MRQQQQKATMPKARQSYTCHNCGRPLPTDEAGTPTTSVWFDGKWYCPDCKNRPREERK